MTLFNNALPGSGPGKQTKGKVIGIMPDLANGGCIVLLHVDDRYDAQHGNRCAASQEVRNAGREQQ